MAKMKPFGTDLKFLLLNQRTTIYPLSKDPKIDTNKSQYPNIDNIKQEPREFGSMKIKKDKIEF